jgi:hypothetical protein
MPDQASRGSRYGSLLRVYLSPAQHEELRRMAGDWDLSVSAAARQAIARTISAPLGSDPLAALVALVASEHVRLLLETIVPDGPTRSAQLRELAVTAADARLAQLRHQMADEH